MLPHRRNLLSSHLVLSGEPKGSPDSCLLKVVGYFLYLFFWFGVVFFVVVRLMTANISLTSFKTVQIFMFLFCPCTYFVLCDFCQTLWLTLKHLVTEEAFIFFLVTDGQFEWTSPFLTQRDWASEDDEWGCFKTSFSSGSPSLHLPPCMRIRNAELTDIYTPTISKWRNSFNRSSNTDHCKLDQHSMNTLWRHLCVFEDICVFFVQERLQRKTSHSELRLCSEAVF